MWKQDHQEMKEILHLQRKTLESLEHIAHTLHRIEWEIAHLHQPFPTSIAFQENTMLPPVAGNTLIYTGVLAPAGAVYPTGTSFSVVSSDTTVTPTVDPTGLIVTIPLPATFVDDPAAPFNVIYTATGPNPGESITATITPSAPAVFPSGITFSQTQ